MTRERYHSEVLPNGFTRIDDRETGLVSLLNSDGTLRSGYEFMRRGYLAGSVEASLEASTVSTKTPNLDN